MSADRMVILTREPTDNAVLRDALTAAGLTVLEVPCVATRHLTFVAEGLAECAGVAVTSRRAVEAAASHDWSTFDGVLGVVGEGTGDAVERLWGKTPDLVSPDGTGEGLAACFAGRLEAGKTVFYLRGNKTTGTLQKGLEEAGIRLVETVVYENVAPTVPTLAAVPDDALAVFASPSAANRFFAANEALISSIQPVAIGNTTAAALRRLNAREPAVAEAPTPAGLLDVIRQLTGR